MSKSNSDIINNDLVRRFQKIPTAPAGRGAMPGHNFRLEAEYYDKLKTHCQRQGLSVGAVIRVLIYEYLESVDLL